MKPRIPPNLTSMLPAGRSSLSSISHFRFSAGPHSSRNYSTQAPAPTKSVPPSQWLPHTRSRIGKCIQFGLSSTQGRRAAEVCGILGTEWRSLVAGSEGFLSCKKRAGLVRQGVVWGEMDSMGHVNNVTYVRYAESARVNWASNIGIHMDPSHRHEWSSLATPKGIGMILKSIKVDYKFPMTYPDSISVFHKLSAPPCEGSSFCLDVLIMSELHQRAAARAEEDIVVYDYKTGGKVEIQPFMRSAFERIWEEQESERRRVEKRKEEVEALVRELEKGSWDDPNAKEDMGGAAVSPTSVPSKQVERVDPGAAQAENDFGSQGENAADKSAAILDDSQQKAKLPRSVKRGPSALSLLKELRSGNRTKSGKGGAEADATSEGQKRGTWAGPNLRKKTWA